MREWCVVLDTTSQGAAEQVGDALSRQSIDVDVDAAEARVWCFATSERAAKRVEEQARRCLQQMSLWESALQYEPKLRVWNEKHHRYVDPGHPDEDPDTRRVWIKSDLDPADVRWCVRLELASVFEFRRVRRQLPRLRRPIIATGNKDIELGARDETDAEEVATAAARLEGVASVKTEAIRGPVKRWWIRQRLAGNYAPDVDGSGVRYAYFDLGGAGGGGHGGGGHGGHGGNGGGGGHGH